jgi:hypothetical protein
MWDGWGNSAAPDKTGDPAEMKKRITYGYPNTLY